jgi:hypothetical protein
LAGTAEWNYSWAYGKQMITDVYADRVCVQNEVLWRRYKEREAVLLADDGSLPPLCPRPGGRTEKVGNPVAFKSLKKASRGISMM